MMRLDWTTSGYQFVDAGSEKARPNKSAKRPEVEMAGGSPEFSHKALPIPLIGVGFIMVLVFMAGITIGMGIA